MRIEAGAMRSDIALPNLRRRIQDQLTAPLDAVPNAVRAAGSMDPVLAAVVVALIGFGVVMVYSASTVYATTTFKDPQYFLARQAMYAVVALTVLFVTSRFDYHRLYKLTYPVLAGVGILMVLCVAGLGHSAGGATRWISIGPVHVQPAEMSKLAIVLWLAYSLAKKADKVKSFAVGFLPHLLVAALFMFLCMKHTDLGSSVVLLLLTFTMLFIAGAKLGYILGAGILGTTFGVAAIRYSAFRNSRYQAWLHLDEHKQDVGYQVWQSLISIG